MNRPMIISKGIMKFIGLANVIIEKLYNPCNSAAKNIPDPTNSLLFSSLSDAIAKKYPTRAEHNVCNKVAPMNLIKLIVIVVSNNLLTLR